MQIVCPAALLARALGAAGMASLEAERGRRESYTLSAVQAEAILRMTLGSLVNLEQEKLSGEHRELLSKIDEYVQILADPQRIRDIIRDELQQMADKYADDRRTQITDEEPADVDLGELIAEEAMVVTISQQGYIKRTPAATYRRQRRGGKGIRGASADEDDPISQLFAASTHDYLLFFTNSGRVHWRKVYEIPQLGRESRGRAIVNLLRLSEGEKISGCLAVRDFSQADRYLLMATRRGQVKKTALSEFSRPKRGGIIAIGLREGDELVDVVVAGPGDEVVLATAQGQALRFRQSAVRAMGRQAGGVRGIRLREGDELVGMVVADPEGALLTACLHGYGKRTPFGPNASEPEGGTEPEHADADASEETGEPLEPDEPTAAEADADADATTEGEEPAFDATSSAARYPTKGRGGLGVRDIRTTERNGPVIGIASVRDDDELLMISARGKIQRINAADVRLTGRNTQGVRIMTLEDADTLAAIVRLPRDANGPAPVAPPRTPMPQVQDEGDDDENAASPPPPPTDGEDE
jgi:DNA gyrase subunit A